MPSSKSISNRLLILREIAQNNLIINNLSAADDTKILDKILCQVRNNSLLNIDIGNAGTAFRFLTAYLSTTKGTFILNGSQRLQQRPIAPLVDSLKKLGAQIAYVNQNGFAPLFIEGSELIGGAVDVDCSLSSQFATALMLIAPKLYKGLDLQINNLTSAPYVEMTYKLLQQLQIPIIQISSNRYKIEHHDIKKQEITVESDWSSASFWYAFATVAKNAKLSLSNLTKNSIQGDKILSEIYRDLGIDTVFDGYGATIQKVSEPKIKFFTQNLKDYPDIAIPLIINLILLGVKFEISGLENLHHKESDRIIALSSELTKVGIKLIEKKYGTLSWEGQLRINHKLNFDPHNDHRLAMAFAQFAMLKDIEIINAQCVSKSYPDFWINIQKLYQ